MNHLLNKDIEHKAKCKAVALSLQIHGEPHAKWLHSHLETKGTYEEAIKIGLIENNKQHKL